jgi:hypothetical protein
VPVLIVAGKVDFNLKTMCLCVSVRILLKVVLVGVIEQERPRSFRFTYVTWHPEAYMVKPCGLAAATRVHVHEIQAVSAAKLVDPSWRRPLSGVAAGDHQASGEERGDWPCDEHQHGRRRREQARLRVQGHHLGGGERHGEPADVVLPG